MRGVDERRANAFRGVEFRTKFISLNTNLCGGTIAQRRERLRRAFSGKIMVTVWFTVRLAVA